MLAREIIILIYKDSHPDFTDSYEQQYIMTRISVLTLVWSGLDSSSSVQSLWRNRRQLAPGDSQGQELFLYFKAENPKIARVSTILQTAVNRVFHIDGDGSPRLWRES